MNYNVNFEPNNILQLSRSIVPVNILENIKNYNDKMTISQVVRFFEKQGVDFTKTMIQNYVRVHVLPPPTQKRYYTKYHLILLALINDLKNVYSLDEIRKVISPILKDINTFEDDMLNITALYGIYAKLYKSTIERFEHDLPLLMEQVTSLVSQSGDVQEQEKQTVNYFMTILTLMAQSIATKEFVRVLIGDFTKSIDKQN